MLIFSLYTQQIKVRLVAIEHFLFFVNIPFNHQIISILATSFLSYTFSHLFIILFLQFLSEDTNLNIFLISLYVQVDPEKAYSDCIYDYCSCQNFDPRCFCPIFSAYGDECAAKVILIQVILTVIYFNSDLFSTF